MHGLRPAWRFVVAVPEALEVPHLRGTAGAVPDAVESAVEAALRLRSRVETLPLVPREPSRAEEIGALLRY